MAGRINNPFSAAKVRYDGAYQCPIGNGYSYFRFFPDGRVVSVEASADIKEASKLLHHETMIRGLYDSKDSGIEFDIITYGKETKYIGTFVKNKLNLTVYSQTDFSVKNYEYTFIHVDGFYVDPQESRPRNNNSSSSSYSSSTSYSSSSRRPGLGLSIACMAFGIASMVLGTVAGLGIVCAIVSMVLNRICTNRNGRNGFTTAGRITSVIGILIGILYLFVYCSAALAARSYR